MPRHPIQQSITFLHPVYSPKGGIEGAIVQIDDQRSQLVFKPAPHLEEAMAALSEGDVFEARIESLAPSDKGTSEHPVHELIELAVVPESRHDEGAAVTSGQVVRMNYARHGEANGVVLDNGDFVHLRPDGQRRVRLAVGDRVDAVGEARALCFGAGRVIEATRVNGEDIATPKPKPKPHDAKHVGHKPSKPTAPRAHPAR